MIVDLHAPWSGRPIAQVAQAGPIEAWLAARGAERALSVTRSLSPRQRAVILRTLAAAVRDQGEALALLLRDEGGKPVTLGRLEVARSVALLEAYAAETLRTDVDLDTAASVGGRMMVSRAVPRGPTLAFTPFASPLLGVCVKLGAAVAVGCPIVVRPAPRTPSPALALGVALVAAGWPEDAISVLPCDDSVADRLVTDPRFATVTFACRPRGPWRAHARPSERGGRRGIVLDRQTHVTVLIEADADLDATVAQLARDTYAHAGQLCTSMQRFLVHEQVHEEVCTRFADAAAAVPRGDPARDDVVCGPIIDEGEATRILAFLTRAEGLGATRIVGGERSGNLVTPTALVADAPLVDLLGDEPSGPVVVIEPYPSLDVALDRLNRRHHGSETGLYTRSMAKVWQAFDRLAGGGLVHNGHPQSGHPQSGHPQSGHPEGAPEPAGDAPPRQMVGEARGAMATLCEARTLYLDG